MDTIKPVVVAPPSNISNPNEPVKSAPVVSTNTPMDTSKTPSNTPIPSLPSPASSTANLSIYPELVVYALIVYGFYFAAKYTKTSIMSNDPTANGLFNVFQLQYKTTLTDVDTPKDRDDRSAVAKDLELLKASDPTAYRKLLTALGDGPSDDDSGETEEDTED